MKILIVYSGDEIFCSLAKRLSDKISKIHSVDIAREVVHHSAYAVLGQRVRRAGLIRGGSQFIFKVFDVLFLRGKVRRTAKLSLGDFSTFDIPTLNSPGARDFVQTKGYDFVVAIATSIVKESALASPRYGYLNLHPGILPMYRGIGNFWAVMNEDFENIGCTVHWMTSAIDKGKVVLIRSLNDRFIDLWDMNYRAMCSGVDALAELINNGSLLDAEVVVDDRNAEYYSWNGFWEYLVFRSKILARNS